MEHFGKWLLEVSKGTLAVTTRSEHYIQLSEPDLGHLGDREGALPGS